MGELNKILLRGGPFFTLPKHIQRKLYLLTFPTAETAWEIAFKLGISTASLKRFLKQNPDLPKPRLRPTPAELLLAKQNLSKAERKALFGMEEV